MTQRTTSKRTTSYIRFDPLTRVIPNQRYSEKNGEQTWTVCGGLSYYIGSRKSEYWVYVPNGYRVTGPDVPSFFKDWLKPCEKFGQAAIVHQYLCNTGKVRVRGYRSTVSRQEANEVFLQAMKIIGVSWFKRTVLYYAARWKNDSDELPEVMDTVY